MSTCKNRVRVRDVIDSPLAVSSRDGQRLFAVIRDHMAAQQATCIDFSEVHNVTSAFLNAAIGRLYGEFPHDQLTALLQVDNLGAGHAQLARDVVRRAKTYFGTDPRERDAPETVLAG